MKEKIQKHRLVLLLGILVALIFFYLGVNTWMENQGSGKTPPPVVRVKPPVQIKPPSPPVKPETPKPETAQDTGDSEKVERAKPVRVVKEPTPKPEIKKVERKAVAKTTDSQKATEKPKSASKKDSKAKAEKTQLKKRTKVEEKPKKVVKKTAGKRSTKEFIVQIGAFKKKENADRALNAAKSKGYDTFVIEEEGLYKVRVRVKATSLISALKSVRRDFKNSFVVR